jgi:hypothetical protein
MIKIIINKVLSMLWNNLVSLDYFSFKSLSWKVSDLNLDRLTFNFIKISTQIMNKISKVWQNEKSFNLCQNGKGTTICSCFDVMLEGKGFDLLSYFICIFE